MKPTARKTLTCLILILSILTLQKRASADDQVGVKEVSPVEDLMREHGALNRILLIYEEILKRIKTKQAYDPTLVKKSATLIHRFIEEYHEKLEEDFVFPRLRKAGKNRELVETLFAQHHAGKQVTETIIAASTPDQLENALTRFIRMYRPHEAREDTIVFPSFKTVLTQKDYDQLGDQFEDREHELFGKEGFDDVVKQIAEIEKALNIFDLSKFTPGP